MLIVGETAAASFTRLWSLPWSRTNHDAVDLRADGPKGASLSLFGEFAHAAQEEWCRAENDLGCHLDELIVEMASSVPMVEEVQRV